MYLSSVLDTQGSFSDMALNDPIQAAAPDFVLTEQKDLTVLADAQQPLYQAPVQTTPAPAPTFWQKYKMPIIGVIALVLVAGFLTGKKR